MTGFVKLIFEASVTAGLAALAVILIRLVMKKAPKRWAYALWAVVFFRCLCPFSAESAVSLFNVIPERTPEVLETTETSAIVSEINTRPAVMEQVETDLQSYGYTPYPVPVSAEPVKEISAPVKKPVNKSFIFFAVWAAGALAMTLYGVISYILLMRKLRTAVKTEDGVYESDLISTAFSAGFFPPKIYVPCGLFEEERKLIIAHERVHIRRLDYIVKPVAFLALALHWFNPIIWLAFALMTRDMELSCDEAVLKIFGAGEKKAYSEALLHVSMKRSGLVDNYKFMPLAFAETGIKGRVKNVLKYKKPTLIVTVLAAAVVIAACAVLGTNAKSKAEDIPEEIEYIEYRRGVTNHLIDVNGNDIYFSVDRLNEPKNSGFYYSRALVEGDIDFDSSTVIFGDSSLKRLIMAVDMTEFKINSLEVFEEDGKNFLKAQFEFTLAEDAVQPIRDGLIRLGGDEEPRLLMVEGGGNDRVYTVSAEYELKSNDSGRFAFMLKEFGDIPVYVNADLIKYYELSEGETVYTLENGKRVFIENKPTETANIDDAGYVIAFDPDTSKTARSRSVLVGMRGKNNELERYCGVDFSNKEITSFEVNNIQVMPSLFTAVMRITFAEGEEVSVIDVNNADESESEEFRSVRLIESDGENEYLLYLTAFYDISDVDDYVIELYGFDNVTSQINFTEEQDITHIYPIITINTNLELNKYKSAEYTRISGGGAQFTLETGETGYVAYGLSEISIIQGNDKGTFSAKGIKDKGVSIGCFKTISEGSEEMDFCDVLDFGDHPITAVTIENMYTEKIGSVVKLYTKIKVACPESDGLINNMAVNDDDCEIAIAKLINDEYLFTIVKEYDTSDAVIDGFAVVVSGLYDVPVYVNSAFDPLLMPHISLASMGEDLTEEEKALREEKARMAFWESENLKRKIEEQRRIAEEAVAQKKLAEEAEQKRREEEEQRKLAEEKQKELFEYEGAEKYGIEFIETALKEGNVSAAYLDGTNVLILFDDGTFWYDIIIRNYSHFPHQTDYTLNDGVLVLNYDDGGALYFRQEDDKFILDESSSKRGSKMEAPFYGDGYTLTSYETVVGVTEEAEEMLSSSRPLRYPVDGVVTADYGINSHKGIDFAASEGTPVYAAENGTVLNADDDSNGYGLCVIIDHRIDMETVYAHLSDITVKEGDEVKKGDLIGHSGSTGDTTGNELHFEVRINGAHVDPMNYLGLRHFDGDKYTE